MKDHVGFIKAAIMVMSERPDLVVLMIGREVRANTAFLLSDFPETIVSRFYFLGEVREIRELNKSFQPVFVNSRNSLYLRIY